MTTHPEIPTDMRLDLAQKTLAANKLTLELFDAIERGDLTIACMKLEGAITHLLDINSELKPVALMALIGMGFSINTEGPS